MMLAQLLMLGAVLFHFRRGVARIYGDNFATLRWVLAGFVAYFLVSLLRMLLTHRSAHMIDGPVRFVLAFSCIGFVLYFKPPIRWFWSGLCVGAVAVGIFALVQRFGYHIDRVEGYTHHPITFGDLALALGLMAFCSASYFRNTRLAYLPGFALLCCMVASLLSGSRGGWVALLFAVPPLVRYGRTINGKVVLAGCVLVLLLFAVAVAVPATGIADRIALAVSEVQGYLHRGDASTSVGIRLELWKASWLMFTDHPLLGVGRDQFFPVLQALADQGRIQHSLALTFSSSHNDSLFFLATGGLLDFACLLMIYLGPLVFFLSVLEKKPAAGDIPDGCVLPDGRTNPKAAAVAGVLLVLSFIGFGLTDVMFWLMNTLFFYVIMVCVLIGYCLSGKAQDE